MKILSFDFFKNRNFKTGDYVKVKNKKNIGQINYVTSDNRCIVDFLDREGLFQYVFNANELEKISKEEYDLAKNTEKYNL